MAFAINTIVWVLLLVMPYVSTDQIFDTLEFHSHYLYLFQSLSISAILLAAFYLNSLILIPRYLFRKRLKYVLSLALSAIGVFVLIYLILYLYGYRPEALEKSDPIIEKILPMIIVNAIALWVLTVGCTILWAYYKRLKETEAERLEAQIASLKSQINPHFLFNTLNNIYATTLDTSPIAADMIEKLSDMMRYAMTESRHYFVPLKDELNYVSNYIDLQRMRFDKSVRIAYVYAEDVPPLRIAPMLLIPFIENAFKHGINSEMKSRIAIEIDIDKSILCLKVVNNKVDVQKKISERCGLGIENTRHRLNLIYPGKYLLTIDDGEKQYSVTLHIDLQ